MLRYYLTTPEAEKQKARHFGGLFEIGGNAGIRTLDRRIKSPLLYQLSYVPKFISNTLGGSCGIRTHDQRIKSPLLYQLS